MRHLRILLLMLLLNGCSGPEEDYAAVYQVIPDAHFLYLGNHLYLARDNYGGLFLVRVSEAGEASSVDRIF